MAAQRPARGEQVSPAQAPDSGQVQAAVRGLTNEERMLVVLKRELYEGSWDEMEADLRARLAGQPYIFKLVHRIQDDLRRITRLRRIERRFKVDLCDYVKLQT